MAFYDDMADVATDLLTEFGKPVTFERVTKTFNKITGKDTARTVANFSTVGVELSINQRLIDGTRIQSGDRFVIVDSSYSPSMGDRLLDGAFVPCAYPFTMTNAQAISLGRAGVWPTVGQKATYIVEGGLGTQKALITGSDLDAVQVIDTTSGIKAVRFRLVAPSISSVGYVGVSVLASITGAGIAGELSLALLCSGATRTGYVEVDGSPVFNASGAPEINEFSAVFDSTTSTIYLYLGSTMFYSGAYTPQTDARIFMQVVEYAGLSAPDIGKEYTLEVFTAAADIMAAPDLPAYPAGTTDICGNPVGYPDISDSWAIIDIQPINPAGTPIAYRLQVRA